MSPASSELPSSCRASVANATGAVRPSVHAPRYLCHSRLHSSAPLESKRFFSSKRPSVNLAPFGRAARRSATAAMPVRQAPSNQADWPATKACVALMYDTVEEVLAAAREAQSAGADLVEVRLDALKPFNPADDVPRLLAELALPCVMTLRPTWEGWVDGSVLRDGMWVFGSMCMRAEGTCGGRAILLCTILGSALFHTFISFSFPIPRLLCRGFCELPEPRRLAILKYAASLGAAYVDVEFKVAAYFFKGTNPGAGAGLELFE